MDNHFFKNYRKVTGTNCLVKAHEKYMKRIDSDDKGRAYYKQKQNLEIFIFIGLGPRAFKTDNSL